MAVRVPVIFNGGLSVKRPALDMIALLVVAIGCSAAPPPTASQPPEATTASPSRGTPSASVVSTAAPLGTPGPTAAEVPGVPVKPPRVELVPGRLRNAYPSTSPNGSVKVERNGDGWALFLSAQPSKDPKHGEWAGYCWDIAPVDGKSYAQLGFELAEVSKGAEVEVKLERGSNEIQEAVLRFLQKGETRIDLSAYPRVRPEISRLCLMAIGQPTATAANTAKFVFKSAFLE